MQPWLFPSHSTDEFQDFLALLWRLVLVNLEEEVGERFQNLDHDRCQLGPFGHHHGVDSVGVCSCNKFTATAALVEMDTRDVLTDGEPSFLEGIPDVQVLIRIGHVVKNAHCIFLSIVTSAASCGPSGEMCCASNAQDGGTSFL